MHKSAYTACTQINTHSSVCVWKSFICLFICCSLVIHIVTQIYKVLCFCCLSCNWSTNYFINLFMKSKAPSPFYFLRWDILNFLKTLKSQNELQMCPPTTAKCTRCPEGFKTEKCLWHLLSTKTCFFSKILCPEIMASNLLITFLNIKYLWLYEYAYSFCFFSFTVFTKSKQVKQL